MSWKIIYMISFGFLFMALCIYASKHYDATHRAPINPEVFCKELVDGYYQRYTSDEQAFADLVCRRTIREGL